jgi:hypothetical protein
VITLGSLGYILIEECFLFDFPDMTGISLSTVGDMKVFTLTSLGQAFTLFRLLPAAELSKPRPVMKRATLHHDRSGQHPDFLGRTPFHYAAREDCQC